MNMRTMMLGMFGLTHVADSALAGGFRPLALGIQLIPLGFQALQVQALVLDSQLVVLYLGLVIVAEPIPLNRGFGARSHIAVIKKNA